MNKIPMKNGIQDSNNTNQIEIGWMKILAIEGESPKELKLLIIFLTMAQTCILDKLM